jgi:predicted ribosomally synthesized peptide with SipW-like signal peptide
MAAKDGFELVWSNPIRYAVVGGIGEVIMFLGKLLVAGGTTAAMYAYLTYGNSVVMGKLLFLLVRLIINTGRLHLRLCCWSSLYDCIFNGYGHATGLLHSRRN